jgi:hypothetical protein
MKIEAATDSPTETQLDGASIGSGVCDNFVLYPKGISPHSPRLGVPQRRREERPTLGINPNISAYPERLEHIPPDTRNTRPN